MFAITYTSILYLSIMLYNSKRPVCHPLKYPITVREQAIQDHSSGQDGNHVGFGIGKNIPQWLFY